MDPDHSQDEASPEETGVWVPNVWRIYNMIPITNRFKIVKISYTYIDIESLKVINIKQFISTISM